MNKIVTQIILGIRCIAIIALLSNIAAIVYGRFTDKTASVEHLLMMAIESISYIGLSIIINHIQKP